MYHLFNPQMHGIDNMKKKKSFLNNKILDHEIFFMEPSLWNSYLIQMIAFGRKNFNESPFI